MKHNKLLINQIVAEPPVQKPVKKIREVSPEIEIKIAPLPQTPIRPKDDVVIQKPKPIPIPVPMPAPKPVIKKPDEPPKKPKDPPEPSVYTEELQVAK